ncbi:toll/interleukin-1 receptor domain-containing protein [Qipengyuania psychrotolerans]|uniref:TIR domain-containing protein n=1 Tax=Qipengyuania psychrotolerans TaxID=2867238 RepID=A0ABX8ZCZ4_9SPHN|nr:toll/interleukin-1 receptor domain-containing protein [Qipengyuania psychrotolerans]QZD86843.1 TIR domain-containing protein [Qipengyuania psychrotolerans]
MAERRYKAFISYSHRDKAIAGWLHRALETYRLPKHLLDSGKAERLHPIFKDREELPAADSLGDAIALAIESSDALIVLCSPAAAKSPWIAREIDLYKRLNGDRGVFPVIVDGEPPDNFPAPLLVHYEDGQPTEAKSEPIAADLRPEGDGKKLAKLKLVAGLAHVDLDTLVQRDSARRQKRLAMVAAASVFGMVGTSGLALYAIDQRNEAREQRAEADGLIEYMLTDLREQLEPVGRLELLDGVGKRAMDYYARQKLADLSATELGRRVRAVQLVAEVQNLRGNNEEALPAFRQAARTTEELLARDPDNPEAMFNHGQSLFWVGYIAWQHGQMDEAKRAMEAYADISTRLAAMDRSNLEWQMEEAYSLSNLGTMAVDDGELSRALRYFERSAEDTDRVALAEGRPDARQIELAGCLSWIATTLKQLGRISEAIDVRRDELAIYDTIIAADPANNEARKGRIFAASGLGQMLMLQGNKSDARSHLDSSITEADRLIASDPDNTLLHELTRGGISHRAMLAWSQGDHALATRNFDRLERLQNDLRRRDPKNYQWNIADPANLELKRALTDRSQAPPESLRRMTGNSRDIARKADRESEWMLVAASLIDGFAYERENNFKAARESFRNAATVPETKGERIDLNAIALRAKAAEKAGQAKIAARMNKKLAELEVDPVIDDRLP